MSSCHIINNSGQDWDTASAHCQTPFLQPRIVSLNLINHFSHLLGSIEISRENGNLSIRHLVAWDFYHYQLNNSFADPHSFFSTSTTHHLSSGTKSHAHFTFSNCKSAQRATRSCCRTRNLVIWLLLAGWVATGSLLAITRNHCSWTLIVSHSLVNSMTPSWPSFHTIFLRHHYSQVSIDANATYTYSLSIWYDYCGWQIHWSRPA